MKIQLDKPLKYMSFSAFITYAWKDNVLYEKDDGLIYAYEPVFMGGWSMVMTDPSTFGTVTSGLVRKTVKSIPKGAMTISAPSPSAVAMYKVNSSNVAAIGYDAATMHLYIEYKGGKVYEYDNVTSDLWDGLVNSESRGSYIHWFIKINDGEYPYRIYTGSSLYYTTSPLVPAGDAHGKWMTGFSAE